MLGRDPFFSVIVPLYNKRPYIRRAVESVLGQEFQDFELIVIDDGSTDSGADELSDITDSRYRSIRQANQGVGAARNSGLSAARGHWVAFLDADDMWLPIHLEELRRIIMRYPDAGLVSNRIVEVAPDTFEKGELSDKPSTIRTINYFREASRQLIIVHSSSCAMRRAAVEAIGNFISARRGKIWNTGSEQP